MHIFKEGEKGEILGGGEEGGAGHCASETAQRAVSQTTVGNVDNRFAAVFSLNRPRPRPFALACKGPEVGKCVLPLRRAASSQILLLFSPPCCWRLQTKLAFNVATAAIVCPDVLQFVGPVFL